MRKTYSTYTYDSTDYPVASAATRGGISWRKWVTCDECRCDFPIEETQEFRGKVYCSANGCDKDIASIIKKENANYSPSRAEETDNDGITSEV